MMGKKKPELFIKVTFFFFCFNSSEIFKSAQFGNIGYRCDSSHQMGLFFFIIIFFSQPLRGFIAPELFPTLNPKQFTEE